jgi:outer membrane murein-binding lipoprotein Lpp
MLFLDVGVITIRDPSLYQRLQRLLPRPDYPIDELLRKFLEQPCRVSAEEVAELGRKVAEVERRVAELAEAVRELAVKLDSLEAVKELGRKIESLAGQVAAAAEAARSAQCWPAPYLALLVPASVEEGGGSEASRGSAVRRGAAQIEAVVEYAKSNGGCIRLRDMGRILGRKPNGRDVERLLKKGFVKKEPGLYCLPGNGAV